MVESRCGINCQDCGFKEDEKCLGCLNISKPFWGDSCPIKSCCEEKSLTHCGECETFPCEQLKAFAYDPQQGDNGKRIKQCQLWAQDKALKR